MSKNWYSSSWTGGTSGFSSNCYNDNQSDGYEYGGENNDYNQSDGYGYGGEDFSISNTIENFSGNRGGFNLGYGAIGNSGNFRRSYQPRYGEGAISSYREDYGGNFRGGHEQRYGVDSRTNDRSNYRENCEQNYGANVRSNDRSYRGNSEQNYGENVRNNDRSNYEQRYGENGRYCANYSDNFRGGGFKPSFEANARYSHCGKNYTGNNRERWTGHYYSGDRESDGQNKVEESYSSKKSIQDCLLEGSIVVVKQQRGRPKYQCLHCKITFFNEDHIEKKGHLGHVKHCLDVKACFEATVGKRGFGLNFKKISSHESEDLKSKKVKTEPFQNAYEKDYIEKNIKEETEPYQNGYEDEYIEKNIKEETEPYQNGYEDEYIEKDMKEESGTIKRDVKEESFKRDMTDKDLRIKQQVKEESFGRDMANKDLRIKSEVKLKLDYTQEVAAGEMTRQEIIKTEISEKNVPENNEKNIIKEEASNFSENVTFPLNEKEYACLKPECLSTFRAWGYARSHMKQGCLPTKMTKKGSRLTVKPNIKQSREKAKKQREMGTAMLKGVAADKLVEAVRNFYAEKQNVGQYPIHSEVVWHLRDNYLGFGLPPARIHQIVTSLSKHDR